MKYNKYVLTINTAWTGHDESYSFIAKDGDDICFIADDLSAINFNDHDGLGRIAEEMFPNVKELSEEQWEQVYEVDFEYYGWIVDLFEGTNDDWNNLELIYDAIKEDGYKKYIMVASTSWCGEEETFGIITKGINDLENLCQMYAYENYIDGTGFEGVLEDMFPDVEDGEYTTKQIDEAEEAEEGYFSYTIEEFDKDEHFNFNWYETIIDDSF